MADSQSEKAPCPRCGELIPTVARVCRHCGVSVLHEVHIVKAVTDERTAYHVARSLGPMIEDFLGVKTTLERGSGIIADKKVRSEAEKIAAVLADSGIAAEIVPSTVSDESSSKPKVLLQPWWVWLTGAVVVVVLGGIILGGDAGIWNKARTRSELSAAEIGHRFERAAVHIEGEGRLGAGFFFDSDQVLTNAHVVADEEVIKVVRFDGKQLEGRVVARNERFDLAVVEVQGGDSEPLPLGDATVLERGDGVFAMGSPLGLDFSLTQGIVSHPDRVMFGVSYVQIDASVNPGNSGGALVDARGRVVGVVTMQIRDRSDLGFAVPINYLFESGLSGALQEPWFEVDSWNARLDEARKAERAELEKVRSEIAKPFLVGATLVPPGFVVALVLRASAVSPAAESFEFEVRSEGNALCRPAGQINTWMPWSHGEGGQQAQWLAKHGIAPQFWIGSAHLRMTGCPSPDDIARATLVLEQGASSARQAVIEVGGIGR